MTTLRDRIRNLLNESSPGIREDESLLRQVDSLALLQLVTRLESEFKIQIAAMELPVAFENLESLEKTIERKTKEA